MSDTDPLSIAVRIDNSTIADRLSELLGSIEGLRLVENGEQASLIVSSAREEADAAALTSRELEVVELLAEGLSNKQIARHLGVTIDTAKFHVGRIIDKLDATGRTDAVAHAARRGVIHL